MLHQFSVFYDTIILAHLESRRDLEIWYANETNTDDNMMQLTLIMDRLIQHVSG